VGASVVDGLSACYCREDENIFLYPCRKIPYLQDIF
jgi:hypothetical protein